MITVRKNDAIQKTRNKRRSKIKIYPAGMKILLLFHEAYPDQVISRVNVNQRVVSGPTHMFDVWQNFRHITNAILSRCAIKDNDSASSSVLVHLAGLVKLVCLTYQCRLSIRHINNIAI